VCRHYRWTIILHHVQGLKNSFVCSSMMSENFKLMSIKSSRAVSVPFFHIFLFYKWIISRDCEIHISWLIDLVLTSCIGTLVVLMFCHCMSFLNVGYIPWWWSRSNRVDKWSQAVVLICPQWSTGYVGAQIYKHDWNFSVILHWSIGLNI
jgi:hypothetical protein